MILILADDLTGAAEIAGLAWEQGAEILLVRGPRMRLSAGAADIVVLDTDSRNLDPPEAAVTVRDALVAAQFLRGPLRVIKKVDSVCRGPVGAETEAALEVLGLQTALLVLASPATGRWTVGGIHYVDGAPLADTEFARDPRHPAKESRLPRLLSHQTRLPVRSAPTPAQADFDRSGIIVGEARTAADLRAWAQSVPYGVLPVGSAAFGAEVLRGLLRGCPSGQAHEGDRGRSSLSIEPPLLIVNGSLAEAGGRQERAFADAGGTVVGLNRGPDQAARVTAAALRAAGRALLTSRDWRSSPPDTDQDAPCDLLADVCARAMSVAHPRSIIVSGGETASGLLRRLGWSKLTVSGQFSQGVVALRPQEPGAPLVILKPGSYGSDDLLARLMPSPEPASPSRRR